MKGGSIAALNKVPGGSKVLSKLEDASLKAQTKFVDPAAGVFQHMGELNVLKRNMGKAGEDLVDQIRLSRGEGVAAGDRFKTLAEKADEAALRKKSIDIRTGNRQPHEDGYCL